MGEFCLADADYLVVVTAVNYVIISVELFSLFMTLNIT